MKLVIAIVNHRDARRLRDAFVENDHRFTELGSTSGYLRDANVTFLLAVDEAAVEPVLGLIREHCQSRQQVASLPTADTRLFPHPIGQAMTVTVGGAQAFVLNIERVESV